LFESNFLERILFSLPGVIVGFAMHEFAHAYTAYKLGDPTPKQDGRLTLSPMAHLDPFGVVLLAIVGFGWAKPVRIIPSYFKNPKRDHMLVSLAGPLMNIIVAAVFIFIMKIFSVTGFYNFLGEKISNIVDYMLIISAYLNAFLAFFNLLPLAPLDGFSVLAGLLPTRFYKQVEFLGTHGQTILMILIFASFVGFPILSTILQPLAGITIGLINIIFSFIPGLK
jgi:Zn-dependent protease